MERNERIYDDRIKGLTFKKIGDKYGISGTRAREIYYNEGRRKELNKARVEESLKIQAWLESVRDVEVRCLNLRDFMLAYNLDISVRSWNCILRMAWRPHGQDMTIGEFIKLTDEDILRRRGAGKRVLGEIKNVQNVAKKLIESKEEASKE